MIVHTPVSLSPIIRDRIASAYRDRNTPYIVPRYASSIIFHLKSLLFNNQVPIPYRGIQTTMIFIVINHNYDKYTQVSFILLYYITLYCVTDCGDGSAAEFVFCISSGFGQNLKFITDYSSHLILYYAPAIGKCIFSSINLLLKNRLMKK